MSETKGAQSKFFSGYPVPDTFLQKFRSEEYMNRVLRAGIAAASEAPSEPLEVAEHMGPVWYSRNQGKRGTCTAFAVSACVDILQSKQLGRQEIYSPDFLYYFMRSDTSVAIAATVNQFEEGACKLNFAETVLRDRGICLESDMPYELDEDDLEDGLFVKIRPSQQAEQDAENVRFKRRKGRDFGLSGDIDENVVKIILGELSGGFPVTAALPVIRLGATSEDNWRNNGSENYGVVRGPRSIQQEFQDFDIADNIISAHAVCITGFQPGPAEIGGGRFIVRNSWGTRWGKHSTPKGFGTVPLSFVAGYTIEYFSIEPLN